MTLTRVIPAVLVLLASFDAGAVACSVSAVNVVFAAYDPFRSAHTDTTGSIAVTCTGKPGQAVAYSIALNSGDSGAAITRRMRAHAGTTLNYNVYVGPSRSVVWGDGNSGTATVADAFALPSGQVTRQYPVYARIFGRQNARVGTYSDALVVTLTF